MPLRADAIKNRDSLIEAGRALFAAGDEPVSLDAIARLAGVGIGTLYRHFPTREALVEAVYDSELDALATEAEVLLDGRLVIDALRSWMDRYARFVATKHAMLDVLNAAWVSRKGEASQTRSRVQAEIAKFILAGVHDGTIRADVSPEDVGIGLSAIVLAVTHSTSNEQVRRLLDLWTDALRPR